MDGGVADVCKRKNKFATSVNVNTTYATTTCASPPNQTATEWIRHIIRGVLGSGYEEKYVPPPTQMNRGDANLASSGRCKPRARAGSLFMHLLLDARDLPPTVSSLSVSLVHGHLDTHDTTKTRPIPA
jgi:hypothetical protein